MKKQTRIFLGAVLGLSLVFSGCSDDGGGRWMVHCQRAMVRSPTRISAMPAPG